MLPFVQTKSGFTVYVGGDAKIVPVDHPKFENIQRSLLDGTLTETSFNEYFETKALLANFSAGHVTIKDDEFIYDGEVLHNALATRVVDLLKKGKDVMPLVAFMTNLMQNPSFRATQELFGFLDACDLPITPDGCFLAYKKVKGNYDSIHANPDGTHLSNKLGAVLTMPRNKVDENPEQTCSTGLHVCSFGYLANFSSSGYDDRVIIVKVNPSDVVAVPVDYNNQKMRVCKYLVVSEIPNDQLTQLKDKYSTSDYDDEGSDDDWDDDECPECGCDPCTCDDTEAWTDGWVCRDKDDDFQVRYPADLTANQAKAKFSRNYDVPYTDVRVRKIK